MGEIVFFEDRDFQGRSYECISDSSDLHSHVDQCNSIRVENGCWMIYECPNYMGYQYYLKKGEYPDYQRWMGINNCIRSCRMILPQQGSQQIKIYEKEDFKGKMVELSNDCPNVHERFQYNNIHSCNVIQGNWIFYEEPNYEGRQYLLKPGEYRRFSDWGAVDGRVGSFRPILDIY
ncbi:gamma-crystallin 2-like [Bufo bufo]|uniref:gamma-crystallin 2-like n=1 Tax=Bufo bufo TaxID=8384 RepID=UPI001ABEE267|nr:gamma-crystallin 2-like [Bufo bufo]